MVLFSAVDTIIQTQAYFALVLPSVPICKYEICSMPVYCCNLMLIFMNTSKHKEIYQVSSCYISV